MKLKHSLEQYFRYHPPVTQERKQLHNAVNAETLLLFKRFINAKPVFRAEVVTEVEDTYDRGMRFLEKVCTEPTCCKWAANALVKAKQAALQDYDESEELIFMHMQQFRMFLNQAVTIQELDAEL